MNSDSDPDIVDRLLDEMLGNRRAPDFRQTVLKRMQAPKGDMPPHWHEATDRATNDLIRSNLLTDSFLGDAKLASDALDQGEDERLSKIAELAINASKDCNIEDGPQPVFNDTGFRSKAYAWSSLLIFSAATIALIVVGLRWTGERGESQNENVVVGELAQTPSAGQGEDARKLARRDESSAANGGGDSQITGAASNPIQPKIETLRMDKVPFLANSASEDSSSRDSKANQTDIAQAQSDLEIVDVIDGQFSELWNRNTIANLQSIDVIDWAERAVMFVAGRAPTESELKAAKLLAKKQDKLDWLEALTHSKEFADHWSKQIALRWIGTEQSNPRRRAFEQWLAEGIEKGTPLANLQKELLVARGSDEPDAPEFNPATHWTISSSSGGTRQLVDRFGTMMLGQQLACSRCHDEQSSHIAMKSYWGVYSLLSRIDLYREDRGDFNFLAIQERPAKDIFYERADRTQALAVPALPDGTSLSNSKAQAGLEQLVQWFVSSDVRAAQNVNVAWDVLFGQPLVPVYGLAESEGAIERVQLRDFLTQQFVASKEDLRKVVVWLAASQPFSAPNSPQFDDASLGTDAFRDAKNRLSLFANFRSQDPVLSKSHNARMRLMADWIQSSSNILGQPAPNASSNIPRPQASADNEIRRLLISPLPDQITSRVDTWVSKQLTWDQLVEHAAILCGSAEFSEKDQAFAQDILEHSESKKQAIIRLIKVYGTRL